LGVKAVEKNREGSETGEENTPDRSRTCNLRFRSPPDSDVEAYDSQGSAPTVPPRAAPAQQSSVALLRTDLACVVELWPAIPPTIRAVILTLANASAPADPKAGPVAEEHLDQLPPGYERHGDR